MHPRAPPVLHSLGFAENFEAVSLKMDCGQRDTTPEQRAFFLSVPLNVGAGNDARNP